MDVQKANKNVYLNLINHIWIKYHPREFKNTYWETFSHPKFSKTTMSVAELLLRVNLVIGFWTSAALDAKIFGIPFIELYRPNLFNKGQVKQKNVYQTIYKELELVYSAHNITELDYLLDMATKGELNLTDGTPMINDIFKASDRWWDTFKKAL